MTEDGERGGVDEVVGYEDGDEEVSFRKDLVDIAIMDIQPRGTNRVGVGGWLWIMVVV